MRFRGIFLYLLFTIHRSDLNFRRSVFKYYKYEKKITRLNIEYFFIDIKKFRVSSKQYYYYFKLIKYK